MATASYEARKFGIRSAMPSKKALELCPHAIFVKPRFDVYKSVSNHLREIFSRYTGLVEAANAKLPTKFTNELFTMTSHPNIDLASRCLARKNLRKTANHRAQAQRDLINSFSGFETRVAERSDLLHRQAGYLRISQIFQTASGSAATSARLLLWRLSAYVRCLFFEPVEGCSGWGAALGRGRAVVTAVWRRLVS